MSGEKSKSSGEIGEKLAAKLLDMLGWGKALSNISIDCNTRTHLGEGGKQKKSHGEDRVFLYNNPFHDDRTDVVHISVKNTSDKYPGKVGVVTELKAHLTELNEIIDCAKNSPELNQIIHSSKVRRHIFHSGVLIWLHNDLTEIEKDIKPALSHVRLDPNHTTPIYLIDNARATFLLKIIEDLRSKEQNSKFSFYYPRIGTAVSVDEERSGALLPLELLAADIVPAKLSVNGATELVIYANQTFSEDAYRKLIAYGLNFANGLVNTIRIGMPGYNPARDIQTADRASLAFPNRSEKTSPFSIDKTLLSLLEQ